MLHDLSMCAVCGGGGRRCVGLACGMNTAALSSWNVVC